MSYRGVPHCAPVIRLEWCYGTQESRPVLRQKRMQVVRLGFEKRT